MVAVQGRRVHPGGHVHARQAAAGKLVLTISTGATRTGTLSVAATAQATDLPTGTTGTAADSVNVSVNP